MKIEWERTKDFHTWLGYTDHKVTHIAVMTIPKPPSSRLQRK